MAKKQTLNIIEAHLEKIALGAALAVCLGVVLIRFMVGTGVDGGDGLKKPSEATTEQASRARSMVDDMKNPGPLPDPPVLQAQDIVKVDPLPARLTDQLPLTPPPVEEDLTFAPPSAMEVPSIPALQNVVADLSHTQAIIPSTDGISGDTTEDVDFVSVEAIFPMARLRQSFRRSFGDRQTPNNPVKFPEPIAGIVDLQHSRLAPDGSWGPWESVAGLKNNPRSRKEELLSSNMTNLSNVDFEVLLEDQKEFPIQARVLRPLPYELPDSRKWQIPSESRKIKAEQEAKKTTRTSGGGASESQLELVSSSGISGGQEAITGRLTGEPEDWSQQNEIRLWVHDGEVSPGAVYRYRARIGFFNPIAGKDWFTPQQQHLKNEILLWSAWSSPQKPTLSGQPNQSSPTEEFVKVPPRILFIPKPSGTGSGQRKTVNVDVYRWEKGSWLYHTFSISPGSAIGEIYIPQAASTQLQPKPVDFSTGATLIDIIPDRNYYTGEGRSMRGRTTYDLVYRDADGICKWISASQNTWPESFKKQRSDILNSKPESIR